MIDNPCIILERNSQELVGWNPSQFNPALLTGQEYAKAVNNQGKSHSAQSYDISLEKMNTWGSNPKDYHLVRRFKVRGLSFELMVKIQKLNYAHRTPDDEEYVRDEQGQLIYHTDEEIKADGKRPYEYSVAIFHDGKRVAFAEDEWGAMLIVVAREFRGLGLGPIVGKMARTLEPAKDSGGFTSGGYSNLLKIHQAMVRDAMTSGLYSRLVKRGEITADRAREIIRSAHLDKKLAPDDIDLSSSNPDSWMLYSDLHGTFILYDRKLHDIIDKRFEHFIDNMIRGYVYVMVDKNAGIARIKRFGAEGEKLKAFMLALAYTVARTYDVTLWVEPEEYDLPKFTYGDETRVVGHLARSVLSGPMIDYRAMVDAERRWRKTFDQYDEFRYRVHELADSKY